jgi:hypothetical protein
MEGNKLGFASATTPVGFGHARAAALRDSDFTKIRSLITDQLEEKGGE